MRAQSPLKANDFVSNNNMQLNVSRMSGSSFFMENDNSCFIAYLWPADFA